MRCGRTSDHIGRDDAQVEMEFFECQLPSTEHPTNFDLRSAEIRQQDDIAGGGTSSQQQLFSI